ncbi:MAG: hypothetical protein KAT74_01390, partial [Candidatus Cloacimonetes bacterium]|nr:hypothetical protein [Candidatus Cloacimonadota bacterium]
HDLVINRSPGTTTHYLSDINVINDVEILSGAIENSYHSTSSFNLYVGGDWTNNVGVGGFVPNEGTVIFNGTGNVAITPGETFYNLTLDKVSSADWLTIYGDLTVGNDLTINPGALYSNDNTISVSGNVIVNSGGVLYMEANSTLEIGDASSLNVFGGGTLEVNGESGAYATVTRSTTGAYGFNVYSGGTMGADWAIFEYMNGNGVFLTIGSLVDPVLTFNNCIFRNGYAAPSALFAISNDATFTSSNTYFENTLGTTGWNVWKNNDDGEVTFVSATGDFAGPDYESDPYNHIHWDGYNPDLDITNANWTDTNPYVCDMITVSITVYNNGNVDIPGGTGFYVDLYYNLSSPPASFETGDQAEYI